MPWGEIGAVLIVLVAVFLIGNLWFSIVEGVLGGISRLLPRRKEPPAWHTLPKEDAKDEEE